MALYLKRPLYVGYSNFCLKIDKKIPTTQLIMNIKIYYMIVGMSAGIVSIASFLFVTFNWNMLATGWMSAIWASYATVVVTGCISFMSFRLASEKYIWL